MTSVGVMASSVVVSFGVDVLLENFTSIAEWTGTMTSIAGGRTGNCGNCTGTTATGTFAIPAPNQSFYVTLGLAYKVSSLAANRSVLSLQDSSAVNFILLRVNTDGSIGLYGSTGSPIYGVSTTGLITASTWYYLELQVFIADTGGYFTVRRNGVTVTSGSGMDTLAFGSPSSAVAQLVLRPPGSSANCQYDDLYITMGAGAPFKGDITIP
jgi:hypothetical protein